MVFYDRWDQPEQDSKVGGTEESDSPQLYMKEYHSVQEQAWMAPAFLHLDPEVSWIQLLPLPQVAVPTRLKGVTSKIKSYTKLQWVCWLFL